MQKKSSKIAQDIRPVLHGIGPYGKGTITGVFGTSFAGGMEIMIDGQQYSHNPRDNFPVFTSTNPNLANTGPKLTQDNEFCSNTNAGKLQYTTPRLEDLFGLSTDQMNYLSKLPLTISVLNNYMNTEFLIWEMKCDILSNCVINYDREYTPLFHYVSPSAVYPGQLIGLWVDPKQAQNYKDADKWCFTEARIDGSMLDFDGYVNEDMTLNNGYKNQLLGIVGTQFPNGDSTVNLKFVAGDSLHLDFSMKTCSYDNTSCYKVKSLPKIDAVSASSGYTTGGQLLTIAGYGFVDGSTKVTVDGVECLIKSLTSIKITCETGLTAVISSSNTPQSGNPGLRRKIYNNTIAAVMSFTDLTTYSMTEVVQTSLEVPVNYGEFYGNLLTGYFKAPATTRYRFYMACDDQCTLQLSTTSSTPSAKTTLLTQNSYSNQRYYWSNNSTDWISLTKDEFYYIEVKHAEWQGGDHVSVAVEIEQSAITNHFHSLKEIQRIQIVPTNVREQTIITIDNPDGGSLLLKLYNPTSKVWFISTSFFANATAYELQQAIKDFYQSAYGASISVTLVMYDTNGAVTVTRSKSVKNVYTITVNKSLASLSTSQIQYSKTGSSSTITINVGVQKSSIPISGSFTIQCSNLDGTANTTAEIDYKTGHYYGQNGIFTTVKQYLIDACPNLRNNIEIYEGGMYNYFEDGRDIIIRFIGVNADVSQFTIQSGVTTTLTGNNVVYNNTTPTPYSTNLFYDPIPFDFLYTNEMNPQVSVVVNDQPAVCAGLSCDFTYILSTSLITSFTRSSRTLTIQGTSLPTGADILSIYFGNVLCTAQGSSTSTQITCTMDQDPVSGTHFPIIRNSMGIIPIDNAVVAEDIALTITSVTASGSAQLNPSGNQIITIVGSYFPNSLTDGSKVSIKFSDDTECLLTTTTSTQMICRTEPFTDDAINTSPQILTININDKIDSSQRIGISAAPAKVIELRPQTASPVLKSNVVIQLDASFAGTLSSIDDFKVQFKSPVSGLIIKSRVVAVSDVDKTITIKFGGAPSDTYKVQVTSVTYGDFDTSFVTFVTQGKINNFYPKQGSIYGGTLITIQGQVFSDDGLDNNVKVGKTDCIVIESSPTEIQCRTDPRKPESADKSQENFLVFLKAAEESVCDGIPDCMYTWLDADFSTVTGYLVAWDNANQRHTLTIDGSLFSGDSTTVELYIDSIKQNVISVSDTQIVASVTSILQNESTSIDLYLPEGRPIGYDLINEIKLDPKLLSVTPNIGSPAGSVIIAQVKGVGINTLGVDLLSASGISLCQTVKIPVYGEVHCTTKAQTVANSVLQIKIGSIQASCANSDTTQCQYQTSSSMPIVTSNSVSGDQLSITITGTNFFTTGYTAKVSYGTIDASSVTVASDTQIQANYPKGVPIANDKIVVQFLSQTQSGVVHYSLISATSLSNALAASNTATTITCSFVGGCPLQITAPGLASTLQNTTRAHITVCGETCVYSDSQSTSSAAICNLPAVATRTSVNSFSIVEKDTLTGTVFGSNSLQAAKIFDNDNLNGWTDTTANCYFGLSFRQSYVGILSEVKIFMSRFTKTTFIGFLKFQGSTDGVTYTDIFTVGAELHEGWNYYDWADGAQPSYRYYRFFGLKAGSCVVGEAVFTGIEVIDDSATTYQCPPILTIDKTITTLSQITISYDSSYTSSLTSISPRYGNVKGGETITFNGINLDLDYTKYTITIDDIACAPTEATATYVKCTSGRRPGLHGDPTLSIYIDGKGKVANHGLVFRYVTYWSDADTWGGEFAPVDGESVQIPKGLHLLVDIDDSPLLNAVIVEGSLIFPPHPADETHLRTFDAYYIFVYGGYLEVGTEEFPYTSKLTITMHGNKQSPEIPIYGNKCIGVREGIIDLHGVPRTPTWTMLETTSDVGSTSITLHEAVDWKIGEQIAIAPSGYFNTETEVRIISSVDRTNINNPIIHFTQPLEFKHYAGIENYGSDTLEIRAEVGLLSRNVIYRGDPETSNKNQFGAHIMMHSHGDESVIGRIEYVEFTDVGQAFQLGRYPIHFHLIGNVHKSYVKGNAIHQTYNRAVTIHAVHYLRVTENVAYDTMGHTFFIEDGIETKNLIQHNLAMLTKRSMSLLNTDQSPASFWIRNPDNIFKDNHAAGSDRYGFWFDLDPNSGGLSFDPNVCPINTPLGEFSGNVAHTSQRYGLRIFHGLVPREKPCDPIFYNASNPTDPRTNMPVTSTFENYIGYKNQRNGAIFERVGDVRCENFKVADNILAGIEYSLTDQTDDGTAQINGALIVGHSANADDITMASSPHGIITPRTENFQVNNVKFYNFDTNEMAALGSCSHCFHPAATDSGARTVTFSGLSFDSTVTKKIRYQFPFRAIYYDTDGSLTGLGPNTWATAFWQHNVQPECQTDLDVYDGLICDNTVQVRRIALWNYQPAIFTAMELKVTKWEDNLVANMNAQQRFEYQEDPINFSIIPFKPKQNPFNAWAFPLVTGHKYKLHWRFGLDFTRMQLDLSSRWTATDKDIYLVMNFTDVRQAVEMRTGGDLIPNKTLGTWPQTGYQLGDNIIYNDTATRQIHLLVNGKNATKKSLVMTGLRCVGSCLSGIANVPIETTERLWSNASSWPTMQVPKAGDTVQIEPGWNMVYDLPESPILNILQINGRLTFKQGMDLHLNAKHIFVRAGELLIGNESAPFTNNAKITLYGEKANEHIVFDNMIEAGNKLIANTGLIKMYGAPRLQTMTRLTQSAYPGDSSIYVEANLDWQSGESIAIAPTGIKANDSDFAIIDSYDRVSGKLDLDRPINGFHWGRQDSTAAKYSGVDMRGEVILLSRNIKINGQDIESWGGQIVTSDFVEDDGTVRSGQTFIDNVEVYNCSQMDTYKAAIRFERNTQSSSIISNSVFHHGLSYGAFISESANIILYHNFFFDFSVIGARIVNSANITFDSNFVLNIKKRSITALDSFVDPMAGVMACGYDWPNEACSDIRIMNNIVAGTQNTGYGAFGHPCDIYTDMSFYNNIAHSIAGNGAIIYNDPIQSPDTKTCFEASHFTAYKTQGPGAVSYFESAKLVYSNMIMIDNKYGTAQLIGQEGDDLQIIMHDMKFYGETEAYDCQTQDECLQGSNNIACANNKVAILLPAATRGSKFPFPKSKSALPLEKIKSDASWGGVAYYTNVEFLNYNTRKTFCGQEQMLFQTNVHGSDKLVPVTFFKPKFTNITQDAFAYLMDPDLAWANTDDCGNFPCTGPWNFLMYFQGAKYSNSDFDLDTTFQVFPNNVKPAKASGCKYYTKWNANLCYDDQAGVLYIDSLDSDTMDRTVSPLIITSTDNTQYSNVLNSFMDHIWDGFYTGQKRMSRFPILIGGGQRFNVSYTGTPPSSQRIKVYGKGRGYIITIRYPKAGAYVIFNENLQKNIDYNPWNDAKKMPNDITGTGQCGENRFLGVDNILQFYIVPNCTLQIQPRDAIMTRIRLEWTLNEFYAAGGTTKFADRLAASLGIQPYQIKVVSVLQGSVIVNTQIISPSISDPTFVTTVSKQLIDVLTKNTNNFLGAPILDYGVQSASSSSTSWNGNDQENPNPANNNGGTTTTTTTGGNSNGGTSTTGGTGTPIYIKNNTGTVTQKTVANVTEVNIDKNNQKKLFIVIGVVLFIVAVLSIGGFFIYRKFKKDTPIIKSKSETQNNPRSGSPGEDEEVYEDQYHPKADIDIFNMDDKKMNKINNADRVIEAERENSKIDTDGDDEDEDGQQKQQQIGTEQSQSCVNIEEQTPLHSEPGQFKGFSSHRNSQSIVVHSPKTGLGYDSKLGMKAVFDKQ